MSFSFILRWDFLFCSEEGEKAEGFWFLLTMLGSFWSLTCGSSVQTWMALWLKSEKTADGKNRYSVPQINNIPTVVGAVVRPPPLLPPPPPHPYNPN